MQPDASNAKKLITERVKQSTNILVAVSTNPSVDALAAALGLALMLNKMDKHATAVFSGAMPPAMEFLNPGKTFESTVDSLRDFIISLDKEKADRLRYKVEDDVVRIFITPYRVPISEKDLQFSQGDFNVDLIIGLGVEKRDELDKAIVAHGRILHDATVVTINNTATQSSLGAVDWHDASVSSLSEMLVSLAESFQQPGLLDAQIATALLTGVVAATERFSNEHTTPQVMTMSAQLMAAGANQQLIANNLVKSHQLPAEGAAKPVPTDTSIKVAAEDATASPKQDGELDITHPVAPKQPAPQNQGSKSAAIAVSAEDELAAALPTAAAATSAFNELKEAIEADSSPKQPTHKMLKKADAPADQQINGAEEDAPQKEDAYIASSGSWRGHRLEAPDLGGTLNATTEEAMSDSRKAEEEDRNKKILTHPGDIEGAASEPAPTITAAPPPPIKDVPALPALPTVEAIAPPAEPLPVVPEPTAPASLPDASTTPPLAPTPEPPVIAEPIEPPAPAAPVVPTQPPADVDAAREAVDAALASQPFNPANQPLQSAGAMPLGLPADEPVAQPVSEPAIPPIPTEPQASPELFMPEALPPAPEIPAAPDFATSLPPLPPMPPLPQPDASQPLPAPPSLTDLPPLPSNIPPAPVADQPPTTPPIAPASNDPGQFKIPGA